MFKRPHHQHIAQVLQALNADLLCEMHCYFGGGTAIVLRHGEYRESADIDLIVSDRAGYRELRTRCRNGLGPILQATAPPWIHWSEVRVDQYGIRTRIDVNGTTIKFEIVNEGRIELESPTAGEHILGLSTLSAVDTIATKLLANSDRWADRGVFSRDLIDLAMLHPHKALYRKAMAKAELAYGAAVDRDLHQAIEFMDENPDWLDRCRQTLGMSQPRAVIWKAIRSLRARPNHRAPPRK